MLLLLLACTDKPLNGYIVVVSGRVVDETGAGIGGAIVTLGTDAGDTGSAIVAETQADPDGNWSTPVYGTALDGNVLRAVYSAPGRSQTLARYTLNLRTPTVARLDPGPWQTWESSDRTLPAMELPAEGASGHAGVRVVTLLGAALPGATVTLRRGWGAPAADPVEDIVTTSADGGFGLDELPGWWTATVDPGETWGEARFGIFLDPSTPATVVGVVPTLDANWLTAALTWDAAPADLDLHLINPQKGTNGTADYHVWSGDPRHPETTSAPAEAQLLLADSDGTGPESLIVVAAPDVGETRLDAFDNSDATDVAASQLGLCHAQMQVWLDGQDPTYYTVSPGEIATLWHPVEVDDSVPYEVESYSLGALADDATAF